jgi:probable rRNA maturation factor
MTGPEDSVDVVVNSLGPWVVPEALLAAGCRAALLAEGVAEGEVSVTLLDDEGIQELHRDYLYKDAPTDVLAFALHGPGEPILGDVYLGFQQAMRQASDLGVPLEEELLRLTIHGTLHVLGYRHPEGEDRLGSEMYLRQEELVARVLASRTDRRPSNPDRPTLQGG